MVWHWKDRESHGLGDEAEGVCIDVRSKGDIEEDLGDEFMGSVDQMTEESPGGESCGEQCSCCDNTGVIPVVIATVRAAK